MPSNILQADVGFPELTEEQTTDEKFQLVTNYLFMLREQLRYSLSNLDTNNFSAGGIDGLTKLITEPIYAQLEDEDGNFAAITAMADGLGVRIGNAEGQLTQLTATVNGIRLTATNGSTSSVLGLTIGGVQIEGPTISMSGLVSFTRIGTAGTTFIDGGNIKTETITADAIASHTITADEIATNYAYAGTISAGQITSGVIDASVVSVKSLLDVKTGTTTRGYMGGYSGSDIHGATTGVIMAAANTGDTGYVAASTGGAKIGYGSNCYMTCTSTSATISCASSGIYFAVAGTSYAAVGASSLRPTNTSTPGRLDLGSSTYYWNDIYAINSHIGTSDRQKKHDISYDIDDYEALFDALRPVKYKFNSGTSNRYHTGFIAQDIEESLEETGFTSLDLGAFIKSPRYAVENPDGTFDKTSEIVGYDYGLRYEEFIALAVMKIKKLEARIAALEAN